MKDFSFIIALWWKIFGNTALPMPQPRRWSVVAGCFPAVYAYSSCTFSWPNPHTGGACVVVMSTGSPDTRHGRWTCGGLITWLSCRGFALCAPGLNMPDYILPTPQPTTTHLQPHYPPPLPRSHHIFAPGLDSIYPMCPRPITDLLRFAISTPAPSPTCFALP